MPKTDDGFTWEVDHGAITGCPHWCSEKRAKNWAAVIGVDPLSPGGLSRRFLPRARGEYTYVVSSLAVGDAVEWASQDPTSAGRIRDAKRTYTVVVEITAARLTVVTYETARQAIDAGKEATS